MASHSLRGHTRGNTELGHRPSGSNLMMLTTLQLGMDAKLMSSRAELGLIAPPGPRCGLYPRVCLRAVDSMQRVRRTSVLRSGIPAIVVVGERRRSCTSVVCGRSGHQPFYQDLRGSGSSWRRAAWQMLLPARPAAGGARLGITAACCDPAERWSTARRDLVRAGRPRAAGRTHPRPCVGRLSAEPTRTIRRDAMADVLRPISGHDRAASPRRSLRRCQARAWRARADVALWWCNAQLSFR